MCQAVNTVGTCTFNKKIFVNSNQQNLLEYTCINIELRPT